MAEDGVRGVTTASDPATERIKDLQFVLGEGPCIEAFAERRPVLVPDLDYRAVDRWPAYAPAAHDAGARAIFAFPLQVGAGRLGVLDVFRAWAGLLSGGELELALCFTESRFRRCWTDRPAPDRAWPRTVWTRHWTGRAELFQAQGMVMVQLGVTLGEALGRMRAY
jgi:hypothetical protein